MKKQTKSSLTRKLDKECSRIIRSFGRCVWCFRDDYDKLQCAHIFSRTYRNTRWDLRNMICLCAGCHFRSHKEPLIFTERIRSHMGEYEYNMLKSRHYAVKRWGIIEMQELLETLKGIQ